MKHRCSADKCQMGNREVTIRCLCQFWKFKSTTVSDVVVNQPNKPAKILFDPLSLSLSPELEIPRGQLPHTTKNSEQPHSVPVSNGRI